PPFAVGNLSQKLEQHLRIESRPASELRPDLSPGLDAIIRKMLAKRPEDRFVSAAEVTAALQPFCAMAAVSVGIRPASAGKPVSAPLSETIIEAPPRAVPASADLAITPRAIPVQSAPAATLPRNRRLWPLFAAGGGLVALGLIGLA